MPFSHRCDKGLSRILRVVNKTPPGRGDTSALPTPFPAKYSPSVNMELKLPCWLYLVKFLSRMGNLEERRTNTTMAVVILQPLLSFFIFCARFDIIALGYTHEGHLCSTM